MFHFLHLLENLTPNALVSIISGLLITWLFFSELVYYLSTDVQPELFVDTTRGEKLRINMDITFPKLPCSCSSLHITSSQPRKPHSSPPTTHPLKT